MTILFEQVMWATACGWYSVPVGQSTYESVENRCLTQELLRAEGAFEARETKGYATERDRRMCWAGEFEMRNYGQSGW